MNTHPPALSKGQLFKYFNKCTAKVGMGGMRVELNEKKIKPCEQWLILENLLLNWENCWFGQDSKYYITV
jgi:hypothetical protein